MKLALAAFLLCGTAHAAELRIDNVAKRPIVELWMAPGFGRVYGVPLAAALPLAPGEHLTLKADFTCTSILRVRFADGATKVTALKAACRTSAVRVDAIRAEKTEATEPHLLGLVNRSGQTIAKATALSGTSSFDLLPDGPLPDGMRDSSGFRGDCRFTLRITYAEGTGEARDNLDGCNGEQFTIGPGWRDSVDAHPTAGDRAPVPEGTLVIRNQAETGPVIGLQLRPADEGPSTAAGSSLLTAPLQIAGTVAVAFRHHSRCRWTVRSEFATRHVHVVPDVDLCNAVGLMLNDGSNPVTVLTATRLRSDRSIVTLAATPADGGPATELMRGRILLPGREMDLVPSQPGICRYDLAGTDAAGNTIEQSGADLCGTDAVVIP